VVYTRKFNQAKAAIDRFDLLAHRPIAKNVPRAKLELHSEMIGQNAKASVSLRLLHHSQQDFL
jgi:hypothetical protein